MQDYLPEKLFQGDFGWIIYVFTVNSSLVSM